MRVSLNPLVAPSLSWQRSFSIFPGTSSESKKRINDWRWLSRRLFERVWHWLERGKRDGEHPENIQRIERVRTRNKRGKNLAILFSDSSQTILSDSAQCFRSNTQGNPRPFLFIPNPFSNKVDSKLPGTFSVRVAHLSATRGLSTCQLIFPCHKGGL